MRRKRDEFLEYLEEANRQISNAIATRGQSREGFRDLELIQSELTQMIRRAAGWTS